MTDVYDGFYTRVFYPDQSINAIVAERELYGAQFIKVKWLDKELIGL